MGEESDWSEKLTKKDDHLKPEGLSKQDRIEEASGSKERDVQASEVHTKTNRQRTINTGRARLSSRGKDERDKTCVERGKDENGGRHGRAGCHDQQTELEQKNSGPPRYPSGRNSAKDYHSPPRDHCQSKGNDTLSKQHYALQTQHGQSSDQHSSRDGTSSKGHHESYKDSHNRFKEQHASSKEHKSCSKDQHTSSKDQHVPSKDHHVPSKDHHVSSKYRYGSSKDKHATSKCHDGSTQNRLATLRDHQESSKDKKGPSKYQRASSEDLQAISLDQQATWKTQKATSKAQQATSKAQQATSKIQQQPSNCHAKDDQSTKQQHSKAHHGFSKQRSSVKDSSKVKGHLALAESVVLSDQQTGAKRQGAEKKQVAAKNSYNPHKQQNSPVKGIDFPDGTVKEKQTCSKTASSGPARDFANKQSKHAEQQLDFAAKTLTVTGEAKFENITEDTKAEIADSDMAQCKSESSAADTPTLDSSDNSGK